MFKKIFVIVSLLVMLSLVNKVWASDDYYIKTDHLPTFIDKFKDSVGLFFKFTKSDKSGYLEALEKKHFGEYKYILDTKQGDLIEETSSRSSTYIGKLVNFVVDNKMKDKKKEIMDILNKQSQDLDRYQYQFDAQSGLWLLIKQSIDTNKIFQDKLKELS